MTFVTSLTNRTSICKVPRSPDPPPHQNKEFSIEGAVVPWAFAFFVEKSKSPGTTAPSIEKSLHQKVY
jgi:hypothetical protein